MLGELIQLAIAAAVAVFTFSLPVSMIHKPTGQKLRLLAGGLFLLAFTPAFIRHLWHEAGPNSASALVPTSFGIRGFLLLVFVVIVLSVGSFIVLELRYRRPGPHEPGPSWGMGGKRPPRPAPHLPDGADDDPYDLTRDR